MIYYLFTPTIKKVVRRDETKRLQIVAQYIVFVHLTSTTFLLCLSLCINKCKQQQKENNNESRNKGSAKGWKTIYSFEGFVFHCSLILFLLQKTSLCLFHFFFVSLEAQEEMLHAVGMFCLPLRREKPCCASSHLLTGCWEKVGHYSTQLQIVRSEWGTHSMKAQTLPLMVCMRGCSNSNLYLICYILLGDFFVKTSATGCKVNVVLFIAWSTIKRSNRKLWWGGTVVACFIPQQQKDHFQFTRLNRK